VQGQRNDADGVLQNAFKKIIQETSMKKHLSVPRTGLHPGNNPAYAPYPRTSTEKFGHENC
jgi:hypothetical protein